MEQETGLNKRKLIHEKRNEDFLNTVLHTPCFVFFEDRAIAITRTFKPVYEKEKSFKTEKRTEVEKMNEELLADNNC